ncbi:MAG TPA: adenylate/guanylate cyclase domain-containing protein [Gaiellaceae bacterium]|jgi:predicted ATPase/class 3 adenylate cyclase
MMQVVPRDLPSGTVTFLFTDVEGSTKLLHELGADAYSATLLEHRRVLRDTFTRHGGVEVDTQGDAFFVAFPTERGAVDAAREAQGALLSGPIRVRIGIHTGTPNLSPEGYVGHDVHLGARIAAAGHGGQVLLSKETRDLANVEATDLGEHRLKDFDEPISIFQLGKERFPPLKTVSNTNLPHPASSFVGRDIEVVEVVSLLQDGARLLTLTGPGGSGKTRLAIEAAASLVGEFKAGVFWVGLATLRDPALVTDTIAQTLGAKDGLANHVGERELLLLLDNLEQVIESAPELAALVETCPNLKLLITSRELLRVKGEVEYQVLPLAEPDAVELFCARARTEPDENVYELCRALDNLPLALELAAARASVLSPKQILERISKRLDMLKGGRDADPRQQTLRATIAWSHELLDAGEQQLFARLAVFTGGCTVEAVEEVLEAELDTLQSLVDKSLVRHTEERFWMLETIREYAAEQLEQSGEVDELQRQHAEYFLALAEEAEPHLRGSPREWLDRLEREHDNFRAALDRLEAAGESQLVLELAGALFRLWYMRGFLAEGRRRLESALRSDERPTAVRARALNGAGVMALHTRDPATARFRAEEALALNRTLGDAWGTAYSVFMLASAAAEAGDFKRAQELFDDALRQFQELGDEHYMLLTTDGLAWMSRSLGDLERSRELHEDNLRRGRAQSNERVVSLSLDQLAAYARDEGRLQEAISMLKESLRILHDLGDRGGIAENLCRFAEAVVVAGQPETAARLVSSSEALREEVGGGVPWLAEVNDETLTTIRAQLDEAAFADAWEQGQKLTVDEAVVFALAVEMD